jgi:hypothetical protein
MTTPEDPYAAPGGPPPPYGAPPPPPPYGAPPPPPPYGYPRYGYAARKTNGFAVAALACGIGAFLTGLTAPLAVIFGFIAKSQIKRTGEDGNGYATAGIVLGLVVMVGFALLIVLMVAVSVNHSAIVTPG